MRKTTKMRFNILAVFIGVFGVVLGSLVFLPKNTSAANSAVANKAMAYGIYECYKDGNIVNKVSLTDYDGLNSITNYGNNIILPTGYYEATSVNCGQLLGGDPLSGFSGVAAINGINIPENNSNTSAVSTFMKGMGYSEQKADGGKCASYTYKYKTSSSTVTLKMCATVDEQGRITSNRMDVSGDETAFQIEVEDNAVQLDCAQTPSYGGCGRHTFEPGVTDFDTFAGEILGDLEANRAEAVCVPIAGCYWQLQGISLESRGDVLATFEFRDRSDAGKKAIQYLTGYNSLLATKLTESERISLLQDYLKEYYKIDNYGCNLDTSQKNIAQGAGYIAINTNMFSGGGYQTCWIKPTENVGSSVAGYNSQNYFDGTPMSYEQIIEALGGTVEDLLEADKQRCNDAAESTRRAAQNLLNQSTTSEEYREKARKTIEELDKIKSDHGEYWYEENGAIMCYSYTDINGQVVTPPTESTNPPGSSSGDNSGSTNSATDLDQCYGSAGALGWILCPVISFVSSATDNIYNEYIQSEFLEVKASNIAVGSDLYQSWQVIRNVANILFVIAFLVVLISQITGLGISNYGIKKLLPRLIVVAVLVNISFLLCQFAVDISNVLGYSFNSMFVKLAPEVNNGLGTLGNVGSGIATGLTWGGIALLAINTAGAWLIPLLLALLSGIISVIFGGIVLGLRQAGIIILIVLAPAAIVCYALPNAKSLFDKWLKMFTSLLMVFPICGALMGGGYFASNLIVTSTNSVLLSIIAMLIRVAPFFMIPSLVRTSLMAIGNIGNKVANWGNKMGRTATGAIAKSDFVRQRDADLAKFEGSMTARRGRLLNRVLRKENPDQLSDRRKAKVARQYAKYNKLRGEEATANPQAMILGSREYEAMKNAAHQNRIDTLAKNIALENTSIATDENELAKRHQDALTALNEDQSDENMATVQAFQDMLITSDGGRTKMFDNYARATMAGQDKGIELGAQHLLRSHVKDIKPNNRDFFSYLGEASRISNGGDVQRDSFSDFVDAKGNIHYSSSHFANQGITSYDAASIAKMDEGSLDRLIQQAKTGGLESEQKRTLEEYTRQAMTNSNIHVQDKIATKFNTLRNVMGYNTIQTQQQTDSGTIHIQGNNGGNTSGTIVQTGNDNNHPPAHIQGTDGW